MEEKICVRDLILMSDEEIKKAIEEYADALINNGCNINNNLVINFDLCSDGKLRYVNFISSNSQTMAEYKGKDITLAKKDLEIIEVKEEWYRENYKEWLVESIQDEVHRHIEFLEQYDQPLLKKFRDSLIEQELALPN